MNVPMRSMLIMLTLILALGAGKAPAATGSDLDLSEKDQKYLLNLARQTMVWFLEDGKVAQIDPEKVPEALTKKLGCFVEIRERRWNSRGLGGVFERTKPLYRNVIDATLAAVRQGKRLAYPLTPRAFHDLRIDIYLVTEPETVTASSPEALLARLRPSLDGIILFTRHGASTLLPGIWEHFPKPEAFLSRLCALHRAPEDTWKNDFRNIRVQTFQTFKFREEKRGMEPKRPAGAKAIKAPPIQVGLNRTDAAADVFSIRAGKKGGRSVRVGNRSAAPVSDFRIRRAGTKDRVAVASLAPDDLTPCFKLSAARTGEAPFEGQYVHAGGTRRVYIPSPPPHMNIIIQDHGYIVQKLEESLPLFPYPQELSLKPGVCDLKGKAIHLPAGSGEKSVVIAEALAKHLADNLALSPAPSIQKQAPGWKGLYVLTIGASPRAWRQAAAKISFGKIHELHRDQAYALQVRPEGVLILSPSSRGLSYGAVKLMQLSRCGRGTSVPGLNILDWPDIEFRGGHTASPGVRKEDRLKAARLGWEENFNALLWEVRPNMHVYDSHPEVRLGKRKPGSKESQRKIVDAVRSYGVECIPVHQTGRGHWTQSGCLPYDLMGDSSTYYWAMTQMIDEDIEIYRPRFFHLLMDEEFHAVKYLHHPGRDLDTWRAAASYFIGHLRRRGVQGMMCSDLIQQVTMDVERGKRNRYLRTAKNGHPFPENIHAFISGFPDDCILNPWYYWAESPRAVLMGRGGLRYQVEAGQPVIMWARAHKTEHHVKAMKMLKKKWPNAMGLLTSSWQATRGKYPRYVEVAAASFWNGDMPDRPLDFTSNQEQAPINWECLLDADPPESVDAAVRALRHDDWRVWSEAREQLVSAGLPAAPALLVAMSAATGEIRERVEGCLSRQARDVRSGKTRGTLDVAKVMPYLKDKNEAVRDVAAELVASFSKSDAARLHARIKDVTAGASCIRALGLVRDASAAQAFMDVLGDAKAPVRARAEAARVLGLLRIKQATGVLRKAMRSRGHVALQKEALWALVLMKEISADKEMAAFLTSDDQDLRFRAAIGLGYMESPETKRVASWLSKDRQSLELVGWIMFMTWDYKEAGRVVAAATSKQKDENSKKRLQQLQKIFTGKAEKRMRY